MIVGTWLYLVIGLSGGISEIIRYKNFSSTGILECKLYRKPCDSLAPLPDDSAHPPSIFKGIFMGEVIRLIRNTSCEAQFTPDLKHLVDAFAARGYPRKLMISWLSTVYYSDRQKLLLFSKD